VVAIFILEEILVGGHELIDHHSISVDTERKETQENGRKEREEGCRAADYCFIQVCLSCSVRLKCPAGEKAAQAFLCTLDLYVPEPPEVYIITRLSRKP
jgi:hypothetical protein